MNLKKYKIHEFVKDWFLNPDWWFSKNSEYDEFIITNYEYLLNIEFDDIVSDDAKFIIGCIIIYDQLPRHIFRNQPASHIIDYFLQKALNLTETYDHIINSLTNLEWTFFMLPIRHTKNQQNILNVMKLIWEKISKDEINKKDKYLKRFLRATYLNCPTDNQSLFLNEIVQTNKTLKDFASILDGASHMSNNSNNSTNNSTNLSKTKNSKLIIAPPRNDIKDIVVSLSGGVDSMVTLHILKNNYPNINIHCVHINYANRPTSYEESNFVNWWCYKNGFKLYTRNITEINRNNSNKFEMRDTYELYTRNVRFGCYKSLKLINPVVALGHNKDDCFENILTNITSQYKYENLNGMDIWSEKDNITFYRPLLNVKKKDIIEYAHVNNIPYLYDSTSINCQRGKIRNEIIPVLKTWNPRCIEGMYQLSDIMRELYANTSQMIKIWLSKIDKNNSIIGKINDIPESLLFWRELLIQAFNSRPSKKSLLNFVKKINSCKTNYEKLFLHEKVKVILSSEYSVDFIKQRNDYIILQFVKK
jgi:tRNA(Ile)-lysidine synthetase-like protein